MNSDVHILGKHIFVTQTLRVGRVSSAINQAAAITAFWFVAILGRGIRVSL